MERGRLFLGSFILSGLLAGAVPEVRSAPTQSRAEQWQRFEKILSRGEVLKLEELGTGANRPMKATLQMGEDSVAAIWKPIERGRKEWAWESFQAEVAAYELDKMLGLQMVPPTVQREIGGEKGSLQLWIEGCRSFRDAREEAPEDEEWKRRLSRMKLFDNLISNWSRSDKDFMVDSDWNIVLIDHSQAFLSTASLNEDPEQVPEIFERRLMQQLRALRAEYLSMRFGRLLLEPQIRAILARRDYLLTHMEKLIGERGEEAVLY